VVAFGNPVVNRRKHKRNIIKSQGGEASLTVGEGVGLEKIELLEGRTLVVHFLGQNISMGSLTVWV
jgi:hypothetical protein